LTYYNTRGRGAGNLIFGREGVGGFTPAIYFDLKNPGRGEARA
jgi:hypothetical protein